MPGIYEGLAEQVTIIAAGSVVGSSGALASGAGATSARTGAGRYTLTLGQGIAAGDSTIQITPRSAVAAIDRWSVVHTSATVKEVQTNAAAAATDTDFDFIVVRVP